MRNTILIVTVVLITGVTPSFGGLNRWTSSGPEGAAITSLITDPADPRTVYAGTEGGGVFRSITGGEPRWESGGELPDPVITALAIDPATAPSVVYAGTLTGRLFRSVNRGETWSELEKPGSGPVWEIAIDSQRGRIYIGTDRGLFVSRDEGRSWRVPELARPTLSVAVSPDGTLYVSRRADRGVLVSTDGGENWTSTMSDSMPVLGADPQSSTIYAAFRWKVQASSDQGKTWQALPTLQSSDSIRRIVADGSRLYAVTPSGLFEHVIGTSAWNSLGSLAQHVTTAAMSSSTPRNIYAGTRGGIMVALDGSSDWQQANVGMNAAFVHDVATVGDDGVYAATRGGLYQTTDSGASWRTVAAIDEALTQVERNGAEVVHVAGPKGIRTSEDGGLTWEIVTPNFPSALAVTRSSPATLYAAFTQTLSQSTDGGRTWNAVANGLSYSQGWFYYGFSATALETDDENPAAAYVAYDGGLFKTANAGQAWSGILGDTRQYNDIPAVAARGTIIHAALNKGITTSVDGGKTWSTPRLTDERVQALVLDPFDPQLSYAGTASGRVYRSHDFGNEWVLFSDGLRGAPVYRLETNASGNRIYAATGGGVYEYLIGSTLPFERLPDDPLRLPRLIRQLPTADRSMTGGTAFVLPAIGTVQGARERLFRTDVTLSNGRESDQDVIVSWLPQVNTSGSTVSTFRITLPRTSADGGGTLTIADIADELRLMGLGSMVVIAIDGNGDVDKAADIDGFARVRSESACGSGSVSQSLSAVSSQAFESRRRGRALGLRHDSGFRTNVGIVNLGEVTREFTVVVDGQRHSERFTVSVPPFSPLQAAVPDRNYGAVAVTVISDGAAPWAAYGSSVDNASGDSWASVAMPLRDR